MIFDEEDFGDCSVELSLLFALFSEHEILFSQEFKRLICVVHSQRVAAVNEKALCAETIPQIDQRLAADLFQQLVQACDKPFDHVVRIHLLHHLLAGLFYFLHQLY